MKHWTCRQLIMLICTVSVTVLAFKDAQFREEYSELVTFVIGGYLGQQAPQEKGRH